MGQVRKLRADRRAQGACCIAPRRQGISYRPAPAQYAQWAIAPYEAVGSPSTLSTDADRAATAAALTRFALPAGRKAGSHSRSRRSAPWARSSGHVARPQPAPQGRGCGRARLKPRRARAAGWRARARAHRKTNLDPATVFHRSARDRTDPAGANSRTMAAATRHRGLSRGATAISPARSHIPRPPARRGHVPRAALRRPGKSRLGRLTCTAHSRHC